jgi:hypothetical protein
MYLYVVITRKYGAVLEKPDEQRALAVPRGPTRALGKFPFFLGDLILRELATLMYTIKGKWFVHEAQALLSNEDEDG